LNLRQIDGCEACFGIGGEPDAQRLVEDFGGERGAVLEEVDEDLMGHGYHNVDDHMMKRRTQRGCADVRSTSPAPLAPPAPAGHGASSGRHHEA